ncbi:Stp1/IreP family PP2C-type Ser/Thr phosphatase [Actinospongicola halichondriae]|uniref:Stp1/IreP family PP2C-type Ser/Thr phosphatase n=1 Tax=Actinospongicola halichondriae TaxID=3236844 RepID=UPI003D42F7FD
MTVRLRAGGASDVGQIRSINQDSMLLGPRIFVVADGMGGHQGGEVASAMAVDAFDHGEHLATVTVNELVSRVQDANGTVFERSGEDPALSGMGTTLVAIAVVTEAGEERLAIVNVGDSRAYRLTNGELEQVSDDHSLVGEMVRDGRIDREQARTHPQKNIVTRAVGIDGRVEVDDFQLLPHVGDRYLLCSDGLTDEVEDGEIAEVLRSVDDPDEAARLLVARANDHGGRDNITVVIVDVIDDGDISAAASTAIPDADGFSHDPDTDTQTFLALPDDQAHVHAPSAEADAGTAADPVSTGAEPRRPRAVTLRSIGFVLIVAAVIGGGLWLVNDYATNTYYVDVVDDEVTIFKGRPGGVLWIDASEVEGTGIDAADIPGEFVDDLDERRTFATLESARRFVTNVEQRIEDLAPPPTTSTTTTTSTTAPTTTSTTG